MIVLRSCEALTGPFTSIGLLSVEASLKKAARAFEEMFPQSGLEVEIRRVVAGVGAGLRSPTGPVGRGVLAAFKAKSALGKPGFEALRAVAEETLGKNAGDVEPLRVEVLRGPYSAAFSKLASPNMASVFGQLFGEFSQSEREWLEEYLSQFLRLEEVDTEGTLGSFELFWEFLGFLKAEKGQEYRLKSSEVSIESKKAGVEVLRRPYNQSADRDAIPEAERKGAPEARVEVLRRPYNPKPDHREKNVYNSDGHSEEGGVEVLSRPYNSEEGGVEVLSRPCNSVQPSLSNLTDQRAIRFLRSIFDHYCRLHSHSSHSGFDLLFRRRSHLSLSAFAGLCAEKGLRGSLPLYSLVRLFKQVSGGSDSVDFSAFLLLVSELESKANLGPLLQVLGFVPGVEPIDREKSRFFRPPKANNSSKLRALQAENSGLLANESIRKQLTHKRNISEHPYLHSAIEGKHTKEQQLNASTPQQLNPSTSESALYRSTHLGSSKAFDRPIYRSEEINSLRPLNASTAQHLNSSTPQHLNASTPQRLNPSTPPLSPHIPSPYKNPIDVSFKTSVTSRFGIPTPQPVNPGQKTDKNRPFFEVSPEEQRARLKKARLEIEKML